MRKTALTVTVVSVIFLLTFFWTGARAQWTAEAFKNLVLLPSVDDVAAATEQTEQEEIPSIFKQVAGDLGYRWVIYAEVGKDYSYFGNPGAGNTECRFQIEVIPQNIGEARYPWAAQPGFIPPPEEYADEFFQEYDDYLENEAYISEQLYALSKIMETLGYERKRMSSGIFASHVAFFKETENITYKLIMTHDIHEILANTGSGLPQVEEFVRGIYYPTLFVDGP